MQSSLEDNKTDKRAWYELNVWRIKERARLCSDKHEHELNLQHERQEHKKDMKAKDISTLQLQLQIKQLRTQRMAMEKGVVGGEAQDPM